MATDEHTPTFTPAYRLHHGGSRRLIAGQVIRVDHLACVWRSMRGRTQRWLAHVVWIKSSHQLAGPQGRGVAARGLS